MNIQDRQKHQKVLRFIKNWQILNPYGGDVEKYNDHFKKDFNNYISKSGLSPEDKEFYLIK